MSERPSARERTGPDVENLTVTMHTGHGMENLTVTAHTDHDVENLTTNDRTEILNDTVVRTIGMGQRNRPKSLSRNHPKSLSRNRLGNRPGDRNRIGNRLGNRIRFRSRTPDPWTNPRWCVPTRTTTSVCGLLDLCTKGGTMNGESRWRFPIR